MISIFEFQCFIFEYFWHLQVADFMFHPQKQNLKIRKRKKQNNLFLFKFDMPVSKLNCLHKNHSLLEKGLCY